MPASPRSFLLDVYPHPRRSTLVVWTKHGAVTRKREVASRPDFCIQSDGRSLAWAEQRFAADARVERTWRDRSRVLPRGPDVEVLRVRPWSLHDVHRVAAETRKALHTKGY